jgi:hypothetical protein
MEHHDRQALLASLNEQQRQREILAGELVINSPPPAEVDELTVINTVMEVAGVEFDRAVLHLQQSGWKPDLAIERAMRACEEPDEDTKEQLCSRVQDVTGMNKGQCIAILQQTGWNADRAAQMVLPDQLYIDPDAHMNWPTIQVQSFSGGPQAAGRPQSVLSADYVEEDSEESEVEEEEQEVVVPAAPAVPAPAPRAVPVVPKAAPPSVQQKSAKKIVYKLVNGKKMRRTGGGWVPADVKPRNRVPGK